jgi:hypothetical protein
MNETPDPTPDTTLEVNNPEQPMSGTLVIGKATSPAEPVVVPHELTPNKDWDAMGTEIEEVAANALGWGINQIRSFTPEEIVAELDSRTTDSSNHPVMQRIKNRLLSIRKK